MNCTYVLMTTLFVSWRNARTRRKHASASACFRHWASVACKSTHRQAPAVMGQFEPAHRSWAWALRRDIDAQQESLYYTSASARELRKLYVAHTLLILLTRPAKSPDLRPLCVAAQNVWGQRPLIGA